MSHSDFNNLSLCQKAEMLRLIGTCLDGVMLYDSNTNLYSLGNCFVETITKASGEVMEIRIIDDLKLSKYLDRIQLVL